MHTAAPATIVETKIAMSDPTALGVLGLAMVTFVAASAKMGWTTGTVYLIPWALFLGAIAQIWASSIDFKKNNYFGAVGDKADPRQLGVACIGYFIFSLFVMVAAMEANKVFFAMVLLINILLPSLALSIFGVNVPLFSKLAAYSELGISLLGFYCAGSVFLNNFFGRTLLPLGKPFGFIRKGPLLQPVIDTLASARAKAQTARR
jgi:succinate-acetate transporter protein